MDLARSLIEQVREWRPSRRDGVMALAGAAIVLIIVGVVALVTREKDEDPPVPLAVNELRIDIPWLPETVQRWEDSIIEAAEQYNIDPELVAIIMTIESGGYTGAVSPAEAQGLMQVIPPTGEDIARRHLQEPREEYDLTDPRTSIEFGTAYIAWLRDQLGEPEHAPSWDTTVELIGIGYNGGPGTAARVMRGEGVRTDETANYARDTLNMWRERHADESPTYERWYERGGYRLIDRAKAEMES